MLNDDSGNEISKTSALRTSITFGSELLIGQFSVTIEDILIIEETSETKSNLNHSKN